jgi:hypothetical protein
VHGVAVYRYRCKNPACEKKSYRFTPFSQDAQPRLRGKSPLELAGYDVAQMPMADVCRGWALSLPVHHPPEVVSNE